MTNREIAKQLNISPAALSLILNNKPGISEAKRKDVLQRLEEMGYSHLIKTNQPQPVISNNLCFVVYKRHGKILNQHPFFLLMMESIENRASDYGYYILVTTIDNKTPMDIQFNKLKEMNAKGFIIFATEMFDDDIYNFEKLNVPFVAIDNDFTYLDINTISINNQMGTYQAINHLYQMGHRKIGYLKSSVFICSFGERTRGYMDALALFNLTLDEKYIYKLPYTEEGCYQEFKQLLDNGIELPTAFVTDDDTIAAGVMKAMAEKNINIPRDVSIVGFNDRPSCQISSPKLTSVNVPRHSFGSESVDSLIRLIKKSENATHNYRCLKLRVGTQLIQRESVYNLSDNK